MRLYYAPGACSIGIHFLLAEIGKPYTAQKIEFQKQEQLSDTFVLLNPKSKVPALVRDDGTVLTEFPAIAIWLALTNPERRLLPDNVDKYARVLEAMDYLVATVHMQGFSRIIRPANFSPNESEHEAVKAQGHNIVKAGFSILNTTLEGKEYVIGEFSVADAALFYNEFFAVDRLKMQLPANCRAHYDRMKQRPALQRVLQLEGYAS